MKDYQLHIERSERAFKAFKILWERGLYEDALSRGYYAIVHLCFAILIKNDMSLQKTHAGLIAKLWQNREKLGISDETVKNISRLQSLRENSDYGVVPAVNEDDLRLIERIVSNLKKVLEDDQMLGN